MKSALFDRILVEEFAGYERIPPSSADLIRTCETSVGIVLPDSYKDFVAQFGCGELGAILRLTAPTATQDHTADLVAHDRFVHGGEQFLVQTYGQAGLAARTVFFGSTYGGDLIGWDRGTLSDVTKHEYRILGFPRYEPVIVEMAVSFPELIRDVLEGTVRDPIGRIQSDDPDERLVFRPFVKRPAGR